MAISVSMLASPCLASIQAFLKMLLLLPNRMADDSANSMTRRAGERCIIMPEIITGTVSRADCTKRFFASSTRSFSRSTSRRRCDSVSIGRAS